MIGKGCMNSIFEVSTCMTGYILCISELMARHVRNSNRVTVLCDRNFGDHTELDAYFQIIYSPDTSLNAWRWLLKDCAFIIKCPIVVLMVGNCPLPLQPEVSPSVQMKKLITSVWDTYDGRVKKVVVLTLLPRPDKETELESKVKMVNNGYYRAVREIPRYFPLGRNTGVMPIHRLFLEKYEYFDFGTGRNAYMIRVIKPISRHYSNGGPQLNGVGLYHLRSYVLQELGILSGVNTWEGMVMRHEPQDVQENKRQAWLMAKNVEVQHDELQLDEETDLEDEYPITVVPDSQSDSTVSSSSQMQKHLPVYVQGKLVPEGDVRLMESDK